jgi:hypothetical protein
VTVCIHVRSILPSLFHGGHRELFLLSTCRFLTSVFTQSNTISCDFFANRQYVVNLLSAHSLFLISLQGQNNQRNARMTGKLERRKAGMARKPEQPENRNYPKSWNNQTHSCASMYIGGTTLHSLNRQCRPTCNYFFFFYHLFVKNIAAVINGRNICYLSFASCSTHLIFRYHLPLRL